MEGYPGVHYTPITAITADGEHRTVRRSPSPRPRTSLSRSSRVLMALLLAFLVTMLAAAILIVLDRKEEGETFPPRLGQSSVLFENDALFSSEPSPHSNTAWDSLLPSGRGFVLVDAPEHHGLKPGIPTDVGPDRYSVSMFHQLHCLGLLRESYFAATHHRKPEIYGEAALKQHEQHKAHAEHVGHCFDYLRQAIKCCGDMTLEWESPDQSRKTVDGWGIAHQCRSWDDALHWTLLHKAPHNHSGIA